MGRILAVDYGRKRVGLAVTDPLKIISTALDTVPAHQVEEYIENYCKANDVELVVVGLPVQMSGEPSESQKYILPFVDRLKKRIPDIPIEFADERYTSKMAMQAMIDSGAPKMVRRDKGAIDRISATIILQSYLESKRYKQR